MKKERLQRISTRPPKCIFASACAQILVAVPVIFEGKRYCLSRMDFGLNVAPSIMRAIVEAAPSKDDAVRQAASAYIDDVFINEDIVSATRVK